MLPEWVTPLVIATLAMTGILAVARISSWIRGIEQSKLATAGGTGTPPSDDPPTTAPHRSAMKSTAVSWNDRRLFGSSDDAQAASRALPRIESDQTPIAGSGDYILGAITPVLAQLMPESDERRADLRRELKAAGFYQPHAPQNFAALRYAAVIAPMVLFGTMLLFVPRAAEFAVLIAMGASMILGWSVPRLYVRGRAADRTREIEHALPDMLDMLNMCVSQGITVQNALRRVSRDLQPVYPALSRELSIVCEQAEIGTMAHALENFAHRIDVPEVHAFTTLLIQTERMGTSISTALIEYSDTMRESLRQRADEKANQATFRLLFPTVLCLMPAVYMFLLGPAIIELTDFFYGGGSDLLDTSRQAVDNLNRPTTFR